MGGHPHYASVPKAITSNSCCASDVLVYSDKIINYMLCCASVGQDKMEQVMQLTAQRNSAKNRADSLAKDLSRVCGGGRSVDQIEAIVTRCGQQARRLSPHWGASLFFSSFHEELLFITVTVTAPLKPPLSMRLFENSAIATVAVETTRAVRICR